LKYSESDGFYNDVELRDKAPIGISAPCLAFKIVNHKLCRKLAEHTIGLSTATAHGGLSFSFIRRLL
jgi:hypothetical protein